MVMHFKWKTNDIINWCWAQLLCCIKFTDGPDILEGAVEENYLASDVATVKKEEKIL